MCRRGNRLRDMEGVVTDQYRDLVRDRRSDRPAKTRRSSPASDHLAYQLHDSNRETVGLPRG